MVTWTNVAIPMTIDANLTGATADDIFVTFRQDNLRITKTGSDIISLSAGDTTTFTVMLSVADTASFSDSAPVQIMANYVIDGQRGATNVTTVPVFRNLLEEALPSGS